MKNSFVFWVVFLLILSACVSPKPILETSVPVIETVSPTEEVLADSHGGEILFVKTDDQYSHSWSSIKNGVETPLIWIGTVSDYWSVSWFGQLADPRFIAFIMYEYTQEVRQFKLVIFDRNDYTVPVAVTNLDSVTQEFYSFYGGYTERTSNRLILRDTSTTPATFNVWSFDNTGVLTKVWSLGAERGSGDSERCAQLASDDRLTLSPDGTKVLWIWDYVYSEACNDDEVSDFEVMGKVSWRNPWQVVDETGRILLQDEDALDASDSEGVLLWPSAWVGHDQMLFIRQYKHIPDTDSYEQCLDLVEFEGMSSREVYCSDLADRLWLYGVSVSPDGKYLAFIEDFSLVIIEIETGLVIQDEEVGIGSPYGTVVWSPDSRWVVWTIDRDYSEENSVYISSLDNGEPLSIFDPEDGVRMFPYLWLPALP